MVKFRQRTVCQNCGKPAKDNQQLMLNRTNAVVSCTSCGYGMRREDPRFTLYSVTGKRRC